MNTLKIKVTLQLKFSPMPFSKFKSWLLEAREKSQLKFPAACCLSTLGLDGFPNARFVSMKSVTDNKFIITGSLSSRKGMELKEDPKAALTFWWEKMNRQIRIQGTVELINSSEADIYFENRNKSSQIISQLSRQGQPLSNFEDFESTIKSKLTDLELEEIKRPGNWGIMALAPMRFEFLTFAESRLHHREYYEKNEGVWKSSLLQP